VAERVGKARRVVDLIELKKRMSVDLLPLSSWSAPFTFEKFDTISCTTNIKQPRSFLMLRKLVFCLIVAVVGCQMPALGQQVTSNPSPA
jgi:hypothetical protein